MHSVKRDEVLICPRTLQVVGFLALRNAKALARNTEEMTLMARSTEKSGSEIHEMTRRMENDARVMKFLSEITAFFLPITAVAVRIHLPVLYAPIKD